MKKVQNFKYLGSQSNEEHGKGVKKKGRSEEHCKLDVLEIKHGVGWSCQAGCLDKTKEEMRGHSERRHGDGWCERRERRGWGQF